MSTRAHLRGLVRLLGGLYALFALAFLPPLLWSWWSGDGAWQAFVQSGAIALFVSAGFWLVGSSQRRAELAAPDACLVVVLGWVGCALLASLPFQFLLTPLSALDSVFEAMAGLTTTAATRLRGLEQLPASLHLWRSLLQWIGGLAAIVLAVAVLPLLGVGGMQRYRAEVPGAMKAGQMRSRVAQAASALWLVYLILTVACGLALRAAGMPWLDAICHALTTISLGGFSTRDASVAAFDLPAIEMVLMFFMILGALNFATHYQAFDQRSVRVYWNDAEALGVVVVIASSIVVVSLYLSALGVYADDVQGLRRAAFEVVSWATTTGYSARGAVPWPSFAATWLLFLSCVCASAGSTAGGIKMIRTLILMRQTARELSQVVHPRAVIPLRISGQTIETRVVFSVLGFMLLYGVTLVTVSFLLMACGFEFATAVAAAFGCLNNVGVDLSAVLPLGAPADPLHAAQLVLLTLTMLVGRLELMLAFVLLTPAWWRR